MVKTNVLEGLRKFEGLQEKRVGAAQRSVETKVENARKNCDECLKQKKQELLKERERLVSDAVDRAKKDSVKVEEDYKEKGEKLKSSLLKNKDKAVKLIFDNLF